MPERQTVERSRAAKRAGKAPSTQAGELVREEIHHVREGKHGARSTQQAVASVLRKQARRAAGERAPSDRRAAAKKAAHTKGPAARKAAARKAAATRRKKTAHAG